MAAGSSAARVQHIARRRLMQAYQTNPNLNGNMNMVPGVDVSPLDQNQFESNAQTTVTTDYGSTTQSNVQQSSTNRNNGFGGATTSAGDAGSTSSGTRTGSITGGTGQTVGGTANVGGGGPNEEEEVPSILAFGLSNGVIAPFGAFPYGAYSYGSGFGYGGYGGYPYGVGAGALPPYLLSSEVYAP